LFEWLSSHVIQKTLYNQSACHPPSASGYSQCLEFPGSSEKTLFLNRSSSNITDTSTTQNQGTKLAHVIWHIIIQCSGCIDTNVESHSEHISRNRYRDRNFVLLLSGSLSWQDSGLRVFLILAKPISFEFRHVHHPVAHHIQVDILYPYIPFSPQPIPKVVTRKPMQTGCRSHIQRVGTKVAV